jgi:hypothetical protein
MHCIKRGCNRELACYVKNFAGTNRLDHKPTFGNLAQAQQALQNNRPFATVAMVERQGMPLEKANRIFFVVYNPTGRGLFTTAQLDNKGANVAIPGNCLHCHGINSRYEPDRQEVKNAMFLPFDLEVFKFFSDDPQNRLSRAFQEPAFRAFNRMVLGSALGGSPAARELIEGWYDGDLSNRANHRFREFVPKDWADAPEILQQLHQIQLYTNFFAVGCRGCHITWVDPSTLQPGPLTFSKFAEFQDQKARINEVVCGTHIMPAAEQTLKQLWRSEGRPHFFAQLPGLFGDCAP